LAAPLLLVAAHSWLADVLPLAAEAGLAGGAVVGLVFGTRWAVRALVSARTTRGLTVLLPAFAASDRWLWRRTVRVARVTTVTLTHLVTWTHHWWRCFTTDPGMDQERDLALAARRNARQPAQDRTSIEELLTVARILREAADRVRRAEGTEDPERLLHRVAEQLTEQATHTGRTVGMLVAAAESAGDVTIDRALGAHREPRPTLGDAAPRCPTNEPNLANPTAHCRPCSPSCAR